MYYKNLTFQKMLQNKSKNRIRRKKKTKGTARREKLDDGPTDEFPHSNVPSIEQVCKPNTFLLKIFKKSSRLNEWEDF
jgi:hypothetical protein